jgi:hypothetical protein
LSENQICLAKALAAGVVALALAACDPRNVILAEELGGAVPGGYLGFRVLELTARPSSAPACLLEREVYVRAGGHYAGEVDCRADERGTLFLVPSDVPEDWWDEIGWIESCDLEQRRRAFGSPLCEGR